MLQKISCKFLWERCESEARKVMFVECPAFRRAPRRPQSTNTAQQQRNLFKLMAMAAPVCQRRRFPLQPSAFIHSPPIMFHPSIVLRRVCLSLFDAFSWPLLSLPALRFCSSISSHFRSSCGLQSHAFIHSTPLIPRLPSFPIFADLRQQPPRAPIFFIHFIRCTSSSQRSDACRAELSVHRRGSHSSVRFSSKLAQGVQCVYLQQPQWVLF
jgi:hypothetical protein